MRKLDKEAYYNRCNEIHHGKYTYHDDFRVIREKIRITCPIHGDFTITAKHHLNGHGCPKCGKEYAATHSKWKYQHFLDRSKEIFGDQYSFPNIETEYENNHSKITCHCNKCNVTFSKVALDHLNSRYGGCPQCKIKKTPYTYEYLHTLYPSINILPFEGTIIKEEDPLIQCECENHGAYNIRLHTLLDGRGLCKNCNGFLDEEEHEYRKREFDLFIQENYGDKFSYNIDEYVNRSIPMHFVCNDCGHEFERTPTAWINNIHGCGCAICPPPNGYKSKKEEDLLSYIRSIYDGEIVVHNRTILQGEELDIVLPQLHLAFEFDGLYWHSEISKSKDYHLNKTEKCLENGYQLIHIFEDEWTFKQDIVKSRIKNLLELNTERIYARKCRIEIISSLRSQEFMNNNHIQGHAPSMVSYGLFFNDELVSVMTFCKTRIITKAKKTEGGYELLRYASKLGCSVIGGASKLLKRFIQDYNPKKIVTYADRRWSNGLLYGILGFTLVNISSPNYYYIIDNKRFHRFKFRKDRLIEQGFDKNLTEHEIMLKRKIYRIYDCGNLCYEMNLEN